MSRSVLAGVDGHNTAAVASTADRLGRLLGLKVALVHAVQDAGPYPYGDRVERERQRFRANRSVDGLLEDAGLDCPNGKPLTVHGPVTNSLLETAGDEDAALLVIGSRGLGPISGAISGSVSREVLRRAPVPVVVVPPGMDEPRPERQAEPGAFRRSVVCGIDATDRASDHISAAAELCARGALDLVLVHVVSPWASPTDVPALGLGGPLANPLEAASENNERQASTRDQAVQRALAAVSDGAAATTVRIEVGTPADELQRVAALVDAELIVVGSDRVGPVTAALLGSTSTTLARDGNRPVMIVPEEVRLDLTPSTTPITVGYWGGESAEKSEAPSGPWLKHRTAGQK